MQDFFDGLGKRIGETIDEMGKKAEDTLEIQKYKNEIHTLKRGNERDYAEIGRQVFARFKEGDIVDLDFVPLCEGIEEREEKMEDYKQEIDRIKGV